MSKVKVVAIVCRDIADFRIWKNNFVVASSYLKEGNIICGPERRFQVNDRIYLGVYKVTHLCSWSIDDVIYTMECHLNPEYEEILDVLKCSFKEPSEKKEPEVDMSIFRRWGLIDEKKNLFGNVNCQNLIDPVTCGREPSCTVCSRYLGWVATKEKKELTENDIFNILHVALKDVDCSVGELLDAAAQIKKRL